MTQHEFDNSTEAECDSPSLQPQAGEGEASSTNGTDTVKEFRDREIQETDRIQPLPKDAVEEFRKHRTASVHEAVLSTVAASKGFDAFESDPAKLQEWFDSMVRVKALSKAEASAGRQGEKKNGANLTKLRKIAEFSSMLIDPRIASLLPSGGYDILYECYLLHKALKKLDPETALEELIKKLEGHDGPLTRDWIRKRRDKLQPTKQGKEASTTTVPPNASVESGGSEETQATVRADASQKTTVPSAIALLNDAPAPNSDDGEDVNGVEDSDDPRGFTDEASDEQENENDYGEAENEPIAVVVMHVKEAAISRDDLIEIGRVVDNFSDDGVLIVCGSLALLLSTSGELEHFGMERCHKVYLREPAGYDVSECQAFLVYTRGAATVTGAILNWEIDADPAVLADQILDDVGGRKVLLFGSTEADGWESIVGDQAS